jgi:hypothetical protein
MRVTPCLMMLIVLAGCSSGKAQDVAACRLEADKFYQAYRDDDVTNPRSRYIIECMASKGFNFDVSPADCDSQRSLPTQQTCYVSATWLGRILDLFRAE